MKVLHICLSAVFVDNRAYQENELVTEHLRQGHEVMVIASTETHSDDGSYKYVEPSEYITTEGARIVRLPYHPWVPGRLAPKLRIHRGLYLLIEEFRPDTVLFHGVAGWMLLTVARYKKNNPKVLLYADTHGDVVNSARTFFSRWGLYQLYYRPIIHRALPQIEKILCISLLTKQFAQEVFGVPDNKLEFYPLGGHPVSEPDYTSRRRETRERLNLTDDHILFVQSGKQSQAKCLLEALRAFAEVPDSRMRFVVAGVLMNDIRRDAESLIAQDDRVVFTGWQTPDNLEDLLCAADIYMQPGQQSSTMQTSLCCHCAVVLTNWESHRIFIDKNGWLIDDATELESIFKEISENRANLEDMQAMSKKVADRMLDYSVLAKRILIDTKTHKAGE